MYIVIAGINTLSRRLVDRLEGSHDVVVISQDDDKCKRLYSNSGATVINKAATTISALEDAGITSADVLISTFKDDNRNMVVCSLGKKYGVPKVVSRLEDDEYFEAFEIIGADTVGHTDILLSEFLSTVEHPYLVKLANISEGKEVLKVSLKDDSKFLGETAKDIKERNGFPSEFEITSIIKSGDVKNNLEENELDSDTYLIIIGPGEKKDKLDDFFQNQ